MEIYKITNNVNGDFYIGKTTKNLSQRWTRHKYNAKQGIDTHLYKAIRFYGVDSFSICLLETCLNEQELNDCEIRYINDLSPAYNMTSGGDGGDTSKSPNWVIGMSKRRSFAGENNPMFGIGGMTGKSHTEETREKQSAARKEYWTEDKRNRLSDSVTGSNNPMFGKVPGNATRIFYNGVTYPSLKAACLETGRSSKFLKKYGEIL